MPTALPPSESRVHQVDNINHHIHGSQVISSSMREECLLRSMLLSPQGPYDVMDSAKLKPPSAIPRDYAELEMFEGPDSGWLS